MKPLYMTALLASTVLLSACGQRTEPTTAEQPAATNSAADMGNMAMPAEAKMARSTGTVTAIDKAAGRITLAHQAIPEVNWPAMTMAFVAKSEFLDKVSVGDKVAFDVTIKGSAGEVTALKKQ